MNSALSSIKKAFTQAPKVLIALLLLLQFSQLASLCYVNSKDKTLLQGRDDDSAHGITVAMKTKWWNDNTWYPYGVLYYRLSHSLYHLSPEVPVQGAESPLEVRERGHHFAVLLINLFSFYFMLYFLIRLITPNLVHIGLGVLVLIPSLLQHPTWSQFFLRVHPEIFFSCLLSALLYYFLQVLNFPKNRKALQIFSVCLGLIASTKMTILLFLPPFALVFVLLWKKEIVSYVKTITAWSLGTYFLIGFPQNFIVHKTLRTLSSMGNFSIPVNSSSIQEWLLLLAEQSWKPALVLIVITIVFSMLREEKNRTAPFNKYFFIFTITSILLLLTRNTQLPHTHYVFAFVVAILFCLANLLAFIPKLSLNINKERRQYVDILLILIACIGLKYSFGIVPSAISAQINTSASCMKEAQEVKMMALDYISKGHFLIADPYTPVNRDAHKESVFKEWDNRFEIIKEKNASILVLNSSYYERFVVGGAPEEYVQKDIPKWREAREFYSALSGKSDFTDPFGGNWQRIYNSCSYQVWQKK